METKQDTANENNLWSQIAIPIGDTLIELLLEMKAEQEAKQKEEKESANATITRPRT